MTEEQKKALALAKARRRKAEAEGQVGGTPFWEQADPGAVLSAASGVAQGSTLGFADEWVGARAAEGQFLKDLVTGNWSDMWGRSMETRDDVMGGMRGLHENASESRPWTTFAGELAGGVPLAAMGGGLMSAGASVPAKMGIGAAAGATEGAVYGFGSGEGIANRLGGAAIGGVLGGVIGGAVPAVGDLAKRGARGVSDWARNSNVAKSVGDRLGIDRGAARALSDLVGTQDPQSVAAALARSGDDAMLADVPALTNVLDATMRSPTPGATTATARIGERAALAGDEIVDALRSGQQGPFRGAVGVERGVTAASRGKVNPAYDLAYSKAIDYASPEGMAIEELIERIPPRQLKKAIDAATDRMVYEGIPPQVMATIKDDGSIFLSQRPNVIMMDYIKRAFDEIAEEGTDPLTGQMTSDARFASMIAKDVREATKAAVPEYAEALSVSAEGIRARTAVRDGGKLLDPSMTTEKALEVVNGATEAEKRLMKEGLIAQFEHKLGNIKAVASDQNVDAREAAKAWSDLSSKNTQDKMAALFGDEWPALKETLDRAGAAVGLKANTAANSATAGRAATNELIDAISQPGALRSGQPVQAAKNFIGGLTGASPDAIAAMKQNIRSDLADVLTRQGGDAQNAVRIIAQALAQNPMNMAAGRSFEELVRLLGMSSIPAAVGGTNEVIR